MIVLSMAYESPLKNRIELFSASMCCWDVQNSVLSGECERTMTISDGPLNVPDGIARVPHGQWWQVNRNRSLNSSPRLLHVDGLCLAQFGCAFAAADMGDA